MEPKKSTATGSYVTNDKGAVTFPCPECGTTIIRTRNERQNVVKYTCPQCGFTGPN